MASAGEIVSELGLAGGLLQAHFGLGLVIGALGAGAASNEELRRLLADVPWEKTLRAAAQEMKGVPLLALFALMKAFAGGPPDSFVTIGALAGGSAALAATALALFA
eukprot:CAMPEP_0170266928 /NCGR_PEP_ID=MMETSP0116_2-20130129/33385_1 /TAXON_ID=400756 /ORGANISM="Durinskia baltica, Strain CSIRO CS-38" /LENGTH=106 /DNA_ID=CAMNT_0010518073 /DNA_START=107 /DNA_END=423 /DNA_ORIENTATION=+